MKYIHFYKTTGFKVQDDENYSAIEIIPRDEVQEQELVLKLTELLLKNRDLDS